MNIIMCLECGVMPCKRGAKKYCSRECSLKNTTVKKQSFDRSKLKGRTPWNKGLSVSLSPKTQFKIGNKINLGRVRLDLIGENNHKWKPKVEKLCSFCQKVIKLEPNQVRNKNFCNRDCWAKGTKGINSPVFKGDEAVSKLRNRIMSFPEYKTWRQVILNRDDYTCQLCNFRNKGKERRHMEVDHIKRFILIIEENNIKTPEEARICSELWDTTNGRTLCRLCHRTTNTYGTKGLSKLIN